MSERTAVLRFWHKILLLLAGSILVLTLGIVLGTWRTLNDASRDMEHNSKKILSEQTRLFIRRLVEERAERLDVQLSKARTAAVYGADYLMEDLKHHEKNKAVVEPLLKTLFFGTTFCSVTYFISSDGDVRTWPADRSNHKREKNSNILKKNLFRQSDKSIIKEKKVFWSKAHVNPFSENFDLVIDAIAPVEASGEIRGHVGVSVSLTRLIAQFNQYQPVRGGYSFILDTDYRLLGAPPHGRLDLTSSASYEPRGIIELRKTGNPDLDRVIQKIVLGESSLAEVVIGGNRKYLAYHPLRNINWRTGLVVPVDMATAASGELIDVVNAGARRVLYGILIWAGGLLVFALIFGILLSRHLIAPITKLSVVTEKIARGDYGDRVEVSSKDELGMFAIAFNTMAEKIRTVISDINNTNRALNLKNEELEKEIEERARTEEALRRSEEKYRELVENANSIILRLDLAGNIIFFNEFAQRFFGWADDELLGRNVVGTIVPEKETTGRDLEALIRHVCIDPEGYASLENENIKRNGERVWVAWANKAVRSQNGQATEILCIGNDLSDRKKLEKQLYQSQKLEAIGTLAGGIAHDFNNILGAIISYTELSLNHAPPDSRLVQYMERVLNAGKRATLLVNHILSFARKAEQERKVVSINDLLMEALQLLRATLPTTIEIRMEIPDTPMIVFADSTQIHQIIINLCTNAAHAMRENGGILTVRLEKVLVDSSDISLASELKPGNYVRLSVSDTGMGMAPGIIEKIFDPYFTTKEGGQGTGLGLSTVHGIVKSYGGVINVNSELGSGAHFNVYLHLHEAETLSERETDAPPERGSEWILFVDDEESIAEIGYEILTSLGYRVVTRTDSREALRLFTEEPHRFDLVITDQTMPGITGLTLAGKMRKLREDIPIIICTGFSAAVSLEIANTHGIKHYLKKPFNISKLAKSVRQALDEDRTAPE